MTSEQIRKIFRTMQESSFLRATGAAITMRIPFPETVSALAPDVLRPSPERASFITKGL